MQNLIWVGVAFVCGLLCLGILMHHYKNKYRIHSEVEVIYDSGNP
jgi:hypothetical protein